MQFDIWYKHVGNATALMYKLKQKAKVKSCPKLFIGLTFLFKLILFIIIIIIEKPINIPMI